MFFLEERLMQYKELKKEYKRLKTRAGLGWKILAWLCWILTAVLGVMTVYVLMHHWPLVSLVETALWQPVKAAVNLPLDYAAGWRLTQQYGQWATLAAGLHGVLFSCFAASEVSKTKKSEQYLNYRTLKLTIEAEKEER